MKKLFAIVMLILLAAVVVAGGLLLSDDPAKKLESLAIRHADKLPLEYLGGKLFDKHCASCHDNPAMHAPTREALSGFAKETLVVAMEFGKMQPMAAHLSKQERGLIAIYLAGCAPPETWLEDHRCTADPGPYATEYATNWGLGIKTRR